MVNRDTQKWLRSFYEGSFLIKGWNARIQEILKNVPLENMDEVQTLLDGLGEKIGNEWAKDNNSRKIDNTLLRQWGDELRTAKDSEPANLIQTIKKIEKAVDQVLV
jgi:hypothetical protein